MDHAVDDLGPFFTNRYGEQFLPAVNRDTFTTAGSDAVYNFHYRNAPLWEKDTLYLFAGSDSGLLIQYILKKPLPEGARYLFIEPPAVLARLRSELFPDPLPKAVHLLASDEWLAFARASKISEYIYIERLKTYKSLAAVDCSLADYYPLWTSIRREISMLLVDVDLTTGVQWFHIRDLENIGENRVPATVLANCLTGKTAVLLAGGPSWVELIPWIRANREHLTLLVVARISRQLRDEGLAPDLIFSIDPYSITFHNSKEAHDFWQSAILVNFSHVFPPLLGQWRGRSLYMGDRFTWATAKNEPNWSFPGITVSHQALGMAIEMGFSQVVLGGFDLCFSKDGFIYAKGSAESAVGPSVEPPELLVETNGGWMAETWYDFYHAIPSLGFLAQYGAQRGCQVVNPAKGAAKVPNVVHCALATLTIDPLPEPAHVLLSRHLPAEDRESRLAHYRLVQEELDAMRAHLVEIKKLCLEAMDCNDRLFGRKGAPPDFKYKKQMDAIEERLERDYPSAAQMARKWGVRDFLRLSRPDRERAWSDDEVEQTGRRYYQIYADSATEFMALVDKARQRIRARMEEENPKPNYKLLMEQWIKDDLPGRVRLFLDQRGQTLADLPPPIAAKMAKIDDSFTALITEVGEVAKRTWQTPMTPDAVRLKARVFMQEKQTERLRLFLESVQTMEMADKEVIVHYLTGSLAELEGDQQGAIAAYWLADHPALISESLKRIVQLALQHGDFATGLRALEQLSQRSPLHIPHYAELLRIVGQREQAIQVYTDYLNVVRGDHVSMIKLGRLLMEVKQYQAALKLFQQVIREDSRNGAALQLIAELKAATEGA